MRRAACLHLAGRGTVGPVAAGGAREGDGGSESEDSDFMPGGGDEENRYLLCHEGRAGGTFQTAFTIPQPGYMINQCWNTILCGSLSPAV